jgi:hypothetical protein
VISHLFAFSASRHLSTLVSMLELSLPLLLLLLLRVGGLSRLNTRALQVYNDINAAYGPVNGHMYNRLFKNIFTLQ